MMYWYNGQSGWGYAVMALSMVLFWGLLITGIVLLVRWAGSDRRTPPPASHDSDPRRILAVRFARGEIDETDYRQRLKVLDEKWPAHNGNLRKPSP
jgi:putative membrane protein